jgi:hypothetical protein
VKEIVLRHPSPVVCFLAATVLIASPAAAASPRDMLMRAAFQTHDKAQALGLVTDSIAETKAELAKDPTDREAKLQQALGIGYRGQLNRSPNDAKTAHAALEALATSDPRDPEAAIAFAGWHLTAVGDLGNFLAHTLLGASRSEGLSQLDRAVSLGGNRAFFPAYAALIRVKLDSSDTATPLRLAQRAQAAQTPTALDRVMKAAAVRLIPLLQAGKGGEASKLAKQLLPFGMLS